MIFHRGGDDRPPRYFYVPGGLAILAEYFRFCLEFAKKYPRFSFFAMIPISRTCFWKERPWLKRTLNLAGRAESLSELHDSFIAHIDDLAQALDIKTAFAGFDTYFPEKQLQKSDRASQRGENVHVSEKQRGHRLG